MRSTFLFIPLLFLACLLSACESSHSHDDEYVSDENREHIEEVEETLEQRREELQDKLEETEEAVREELENYDDNDRISKEELEELKVRMQESAERIQGELRDTDQDFEIAMQDLGSALEQIGHALKEDQDIEPVSYRKLRDFLPSAVAGMERYDTDGSSNSVLGIRTSKLEAKYEGDRKDMSIVLMDLGSISGVAALGMEFVDAKMDREYKDGFEKTTEIQGYPAFLEKDNRGREQKHTALIMVAERFMVAIEIEGRDLDDDVIEEVADRISIRRLARMARN